MKTLKKLLVGLATAAVTLIGAASLPAQPVAAATGMRSIISIDAGRKYFSLAQLKQVVDQAERSGYTDLQLMLSNDALRFMLDDMSVTANGQTYASDAVKQALEAGNKTYYADPNGDHLTQAEMDDLLAYAKARHINVVPTINSPGHMDAILEAMAALGIANPSFDGSKRTVDLNNAAAVAFTQALLEKYVTYFAGHTDLFNFGCDEYANDVDTGGWAKLQQSGTYAKFVTYVNDLAAMAKKAGMRPVVFNDGIYYNSDQSFGTFDSSLIISYWTSGWWGYDVAKPDFFVDNGYTLLNTNDAWYYVIGRETPEDGGYPFQNALANLDKKAFTTVTGTDKTLPIMGSTQAIWADDPANPLDMAKVMQLMRGFGAAYRDEMDPLADYAALDAAEATVPADLSRYTEASVAALNATLGQRELHLRASQQAQVDGQAQALAAAVKGLALRLADYTQVDAAIARADALTATDYTNFAAVTAAVKAVKRELPITAQAQVDAMAAAIQAALDALVKVTTPTTPSIKPTPAPKPGATATHPTTTGGKLPQTGNATQLGLALGGLVLIAGVGVALIKRRHA
ncbi:family 20 glycosylhydrolase [Lacticaseibacillus daqingensis]|uniref:family 20 glycosylhydrolase n=1 Tax=Lacticaseibacillus daqingensis TaxID=2486014 RepID=UPI000F7A8932|nr:family 20 glycosylhydrolase [Lacticaseibacillus daqingensis]